MSSNDFSPGLAGVVAFETEIAEPDKDGGELRYRGVNIEDLVGKVPFEQVWGLLVDESLQPGLPYEHVDLERRTGGYTADLQSTLAALSGEWKLGQFIDIDDEQAKEDLRRLSSAALSVVAQSARGADLAPVPKETVAEGQTAAERFVLEWRGELNEKSAKAIDTYWICTAEHGLNASTFTARIVASTGADAGAALSSAVGALSGPFHGGAPARVLPMLDAVAESRDAEKWVAEALEEAALAALHERKPDYVIATNVEFYSAVVLDVADVPPDLTPAMFACARVGGWSAHVLEERRTGRLIRPSAEYVGPPSRPASAIDGSAPSRS